jgi:hypothetical protein
MIDSSDLASLTYFRHDLAVEKIQISVTPRVRNLKDTIKVRIES